MQSEKNNKVLGVLKSIFKIMLDIKENFISLEALISFEKVGGTI